MGTQCTESAYSSDCPQENHVSSLACLFNKSVISVNLKAIPSESMSNGMGKFFQEQREQKKLNGNL
jgi:hypothetical protein